jgi:cytochrome c biogenesis protein CcmG, thiol:disulfide interchange protein DsbE
MQILNIGRVLAVLGLLTFASDAVAIDKGQAAPEIHLRDMTGKEVKLSALKGKVVIVDFWASWCGPCRESMPVLERLSKVYKDKGLVVLGVNIDNDAKSASAFLKEVRVSFPVVNDSAKTVAKAYAPPTMPSSYVVDQQGRVHAVHAGFKASDGAKLESEVQKLLN